MNEHGFIRAVHRHLPDNLFSWKIHDKFAGGVPDAMYVGPAGVIFIEYKYLKNFPKRPNTPVRINISPLQIAWMEQIALLNQTNVTCKVCIGCANNAFIVSIDDLSSTISSKEAQSISVSFSEIAQRIKEETGYVEPDRNTEPTDSLAKKERNLRIHTSSSS